MVVGARATNATHWAAAHAALGSPAAPSEQDWSDDALRAAGSVVDTDHQPFIFGACLDPKDSFYQVCSDEIAEDFGIDFPAAASTFGCAHV